jgi:hypothetical protein
MHDGQRIMVAVFPDGAILLIPAGTVTSRPASSLTIFVSSPFDESLSELPPHPVTRTAMSRTITIMNAILFMSFFSVISFFIIFIPFLYSSPTKKLYYHFAKK